MIAKSSRTQQADLQELAADPDPAVANTARLMLDYGEELRSGVIAQINSSTAIWDNAGLHDATWASDFDLADMKHRPITVYVVLPFDRMETHRAVLRMMIGQFLSAMIRDPRPARMPVICIVDEFPALGRANSRRKRVRSGTGPAEPFRYQACDQKHLMTGRSPIVNTRNLSASDIEHVRGFRPMNAKFG